MNNIKNNKRKIFDSQIDCMDIKIEQMQNKFKALNINNNLLEQMSTSKKIKYCMSHYDVVIHPAIKKEFDNNIDNYTICENLNLNLHLTNGVENNYISNDYILSDNKKSKISNNVTGIYNFSIQHKITKKIYKININISDNKITVIQNFFANSFIAKYPNYDYNKLKYNVELSKKINELNPPKFTDDGCQEILFVYNIENAYFSCIYMCGLGYDFAFSSDIYPGIWIKPLKYPSEFNFI